MTLVRSENVGTEIGVDMLAALGSGQWVSIRGWYNVSRIREVSEELI